MAQISLINKSDIVKSNRIDSEFYSPEYLHYEKIIDSINSLSIVDIDCTLDCSAFYPSITDYYNFDKKGIPFLRVNEIQNGMLEVTDNTAFLPNDIVNEYSSNIKIAYPGDIIIAKGGNSLGKVCIITAQYEYYSVCRDLIILSTNNLKYINNYLLWLYLHSDYGQKMILRTASQTGQPHITINSIGKLKIPILPEINNVIASQFQDHIKLNQLSKQLYKEAENILLQELNLLDFKPEHKLTFEATKSDIENAERFDSEYFQPKYEEIIKKIEEYEGGWDYVENLLSFNSNNFFPDSNTEYYYVPLSKVTNAGEILEIEKEYGKNLPTRARRKVKTGEVILSSIEGSIETSALIGAENNDYIVSNGFYVFSSKKINSESLFVLFKSSIMLELLRKISKGAILGGYDLSSFKTLKIPLIKPEVQEQIADKVRESHRLRKESKQLLEDAKLMVEQEIEKNAKGFV